MKKVILIILLWFPLCLQAGEQPDSTKFNELGVNIGPLVPGLLGSSNYSQFYGFQFKKRLKKAVFRTGIYTKSEPYIPLREDQLYLQEDSLYRFRQEKNVKNNLFQYKIGIEFRKKMSSQIEFLYGSDIFSSIQLKNSSFTILQERKDSVITENSGLVKVYSTVVNNFPGPSESQKTINGGLSIFSGFGWNFYNGFTLTALVRADFALAFTHTQTKNSQGDIVSSYKYNQFNFDMGAPIGELSLFYKF